MSLKELVAKAVKAIGGTPAAKNVCDWLKQYEGLDVSESEVAEILAQLANEKIHQQELSQSRSRGLSLF